MKTLYRKKSTPFKPVKVRPGIDTRAVQYGDGYRFGLAVSDGMRALSKEVFGKETFPYVVTNDATIYLEENDILVPGLGGSWQVWREQDFFKSFEEVSP